MTVEIFKLFCRYPKFLMIRGSNGLRLICRYIIIINFKSSYISLVARVRIFCVPFFGYFFGIALIQNGIKNWLPIKSWWKFCVTAFFD